MRLLAGLWENNIASNADLDRVYEDAVNIGIRWDLDNYGLANLTYTIKTRNKYDRYNRLQNDIGKRGGVLTSWLHRPVTGFVQKVKPAGAGRLAYDIAGVGVVRMEEEYETTIPGASDTPGDVIKAMLTNHVPSSSTDQTQIQDNAAAQSPVAPRLPEGETPRRYLRKILRRPDNSDQSQYDFWFRDEVLDGTDLQLWTPYYQKRTATTSLPIWQIRESDTMGIFISRSVDDIKSDVTVYYGSIAYTVTSADAAGETLTDSGATFKSDGVTPGDRVVNLTDGSFATVVSVTSNTVLETSGLNGGTDDQFDSSDDIIIQVRGTTLSTNVSDTAVYWPRAHVERDLDLTVDNADDFANLLLNTGSDALQVAPLTVTAPYVYDDNNVRWPLWEIIVQGASYIKLVDIYPQAALFDKGLDELSVLKITSADYDHNSRQMRIATSIPDRRLDAQLNRTGSVRSTPLISRRSVNYAP